MPRGTGAASTSGRAQGRGGGLASASSRLKRVLDRTPKVRVLKMMPSSAADHRQAQQTQASSLDAAQLVSLTQQVVAGVLKSRKLSPRTKRLCAATSAASAVAVGAAMYKLGAETAAHEAQKSPGPGKRALDQQRTAIRIFKDATQTHSEIPRTSETTESHASNNRANKDTLAETTVDATDGDTARQASSSVRKQPVRAAAAGAGPKEAAGQQEAVLSLTGKKRGQEVLVVPKTSYAPVARPAEPVPRANKRSLNAGGCYVTGSMHGQQRAADQQAAEEKAQAKEERAASVWTDKRRADVGKAEALLAECGGSVQVLGERTGGVGLLKALIWSRTGKGPKAKNNMHGAITVEAQAACTARATTLCLQHDDDAPQLAGAEDGASAEEEDGGDDGYVAEETEDW